MSSFTFSSEEDTNFAQVLSPNSLARYKSAIYWSLTLVIVWTAVIAFKYYQTLIDLPWLTLIPGGRYKTIPDLVTPFYVWLGLNAFASLLSHVLNQSPGRIVTGFLTLLTFLLLTAAADPLLLVRFLMFLFVLHLCATGLLWCLKNLFRLDLPYWAGALLSLILIQYLLLAVAVSGHFRLYALLPLLSGLSIPGGFDLWRTKKHHLLRILHWIDSLNWPALICLQGLWFALSAGFVTATAPETYSDAARFHVPYMMNLVRDGVLTPNIYWYTHLMPSPLQLVGAGAYLILGEVGTKWLVWYLGLTTVLLIIVVTRQLTKNESIALGTGFVFISTPILWVWLTTNYQDLPTTAFCLAGFESLRRRLTGDRKWLPVAAVFFGFAFAAKIYSLIFVAAVLSSYLLFQRKDLLKSTHRREMIYAAVALVVTLLPWHMLVWSWTGNPIFPFLNGYFQSPYISAELMQTFRNWYKLHFHFPYGWWDVFAWPWSLTFHSISYVETPKGSMGFLFLVFFPLSVVSLFLRNNGSRRNAFLLFTASALYISLTVLLIRAPYLRFWLPGLALLFIFMGVSLHRLLFFLRAFFTDIAATVAAFSVVSLSLLVLFGWGVRLNFASPNGLAWDLYRGKTTDAKYLEALTANTYQYVNQNLRSDESVLAVNYPMLNTIRGFALQIMPWYDPVIGLKTLDDYDDLIQKTNVRYWIVRDGSWNIYYERLGVQQKYWTPNRRVFERNGFVVYTTKPETDLSRP